MVNNPDPTFVIMSSEEFDDDGFSLYWSNTDGWVLFNQATRFTKEESERFDPPADSTWAEVMDTPWDNNLIQFARLLCEINATQDINIVTLCESMDLTTDDVNELFDRANEVWEQAKERLTW
jgi:hypothetical protein